MKIATNSCVLRRPNSEDAESIARHANNRNVWINLRDAFPHPYSIEDARYWIDSVRHQQPSADLIIDVERAAVGSIGFKIGTDIERRSAELGYWLGEAYWGRGVATDAVRAMCEYGFHELRLIRIFAHPMAWNPASARVLEKAGFEREGLLRKACIKNNQTIDMLLYSRTAP